MSNIDYSVEALNVKSAFYRVHAMVYVEGEDDVLFWQHVLSTATTASFEIEPVGGAGELDKYIKGIEQGNLKAIAARDSDLIPFLSTKSTHQLVLYTYGYSIENTLYTAKTLHQLARSWSRSSAVTEHTCQEWLDLIATEFSPLVHLDIANVLADSSIATIGDNCARFMMNKTGCVPCPNKISTHVAEKEKLLPKKDLKKARKQTEEILRFVRGHFLVSAVIRFLVSTAKAYGKNVSVSADVLYVAVLGHFSSSFDTSHIHFQHYSLAANTALKAIRS